jgi:hypothetical protein
MNDLITRQMAYKRELDKIMSMNVGETFDVDYCLSMMYLSKDNLFGRDQAIKFATENGYIESISIFFDLYGNQTKERFRRL